MMYLVEHLSLWLFLTALFAAIAGWAFAAQRDAPRAASLRRQRDTLVADLGRLAAGEGGAPQPAMADPRQSLVDIGHGRIAELERDRDQARARASEAMARIAELERRLEQQSAATVEPLLLTEVVNPAPSAPALPEPSSPTPDESEVLQNWRLRYFEQRVRYLEQRAAGAEQAAPEPAGAAAPVMPAATALVDAWRAREAEARASFLEEQLRAREAAPPAAESAEATASPFASNAEVDTLLRWRMLYLERRLAHAQTQAAERTQPQAFAEPVIDASPDLDRWKWRARYLEARVRHLAARLETAPAASQPQPVMSAPSSNGDAERASPPAPNVPTERPPSLRAPRNGAPDDFTLIDGVSALQQSTLNSLGIYHFDQIAAWTPANVAWVDQYLRLRGRIDDEEWVEQANELAHEDVNSPHEDASLPRL